MDALNLRILFRKYILHAISLCTSNIFFTNQTILSNKVHLNACALVFESTLIAYKLIWFESSSNSDQANAK